MSGPKICRNYFEKNDFINALLDAVCTVHNAAPFTCIRTGDHILYEDASWKDEVLLTLRFFSLCMDLCNDFNDFITFRSYIMTRIIDCKFF